MNDFSARDRSHMDGYSVTEAASVLGVPTERVWELLARGVLSGMPDHEGGMRVFLQPRPAPSGLDQPQTSNDSPRETDGEASPFRELLTEFRSLTERYGQALLALGEARGEVASLRSRVDLLEARMDLRLPMSSPMSADANRLERSHPDPDPEPERVAEPEADPEAIDEPKPEPEPEALPEREPEPESQPVTPPVDTQTEPRRTATASQSVPKPETSAELQAEDEPRTGTDLQADDEPETERAISRKRARAHFREGFADAWARADDPTPAVLPDPAEVSAAVNALRDERPLPVDAAADRPTPVEIDVAPPAAAAAASAPPAPEDGTAPQLSWDRERYSAQIDAPDWWTPDTPDEATPSEPPEPLDQPVSAVAVENPASLSPRPPSADAAPAMKPREPYAGEETMLWFGRRPDGSQLDDWPSEDAAGEMEVASTGRRQDADQPKAAAMPGSQELNDALAALDAVGPARMPVGTAPPPPPPGPSPESAPSTTFAPGATPQPAAVRSPASRAYRRLRRIFPG
ncbi:MAG: hypothetical protein H0W41_06740 [Chloroflexi bacterium]|nr:hypothetical protein [Chloroflexota bacterium]